MTETEFIALAGFVAAVVAALGGAWVGHRLTLEHQKQRSAEVRALHIAALRAEIAYCGLLAGAYLDENYMAPLYRFPTTVYATVYPTLVSETLTHEDVTALTGFYSQVDQMNRGLDAIDRYRAAGDEARMQQEYMRLRGKAEQMRHPTSSLEKARMNAQLYDQAMTAVTRHA